MYFLGHHHVSSTNSNLCTLSYNNDLSANRINTGGLFQILYCLLRCPGRLLSWNSGITLVPCYFVLFRGECTVQYMKTQSSSVFFKIPNSCTSQVKSFPQHVTTHWHSICFYLHPLLCISYLNPMQKKHAIIKPSNLPWWDGETVSFDPWSKIQVPSLQLHFFALGLTMVREPPEILCFLFECWLNQYGDNILIWPTRGWYYIILYIFGHDDTWNWWCNVFTGWKKHQV